MPANRQTIERESKAAELLDAAERLFLEQGFERTTIAALARAAGVAGNTVYWYFPSKDDVLAAVLDRRLERILVEVPEGLALDDAAVVALAVLDGFAPLTATVHERARSSATVAKAHTRFHTVIGQAVQAAFEDAGLAPDDARLATKSIVAMVEGIHLHGTARDSPARDDLVRWVIHRFVPDR